MMFIAQMGLGILANMVSQAAAGGMNQQQNQQMMSNLRQTLNEGAHAAVHQSQHPWDQRSTFQQFEVEAPPFPDEAAQRLGQMQQDHAAERMGFMDETKDSLRDMKDGFFGFNHLETTEEKPAEGPPRQAVALDSQGKPQVKPGPETKAQRVAREEFETTSKAKLEEKHESQRETLVKSERENVQAFLENNKADLGNPAVQGELQKMIMLSHKKAQAMGRQQEEEMLKSDLYSPEQLEVADAKLGQMRSMEERHAELEDNSPEAQELLGHQQDLAELLRQKRDEAKQAKLEEAFLKGPPRFTPPSEKAVDVAEVLPPYLSNALYNLGIYSV
ncbi:MAG: hypothetical protein EB084_08025 [Proteobacteria bacterium]|nr:hypothetical protein [Pseudomonadota bacterium]